MENKTPITIVGSGLVGSLLALSLARRGFQVDVYERRSNPQPEQRNNKMHSVVGEGRSINLAISTRGLHALTQMSIDQPVREMSIPMRGRCIHHVDGHEAFQAYGVRESDAIRSVSRSWLNNYLLELAGKQEQVKFHFDQRVSHVDLDSKKIICENTATGSKAEMPYGILIGTDGSASEVRHAIAKKSSTVVSEDLLSHGYKEFVMPAAIKAEALNSKTTDTKNHGKFLIEPNALHIWPRGEHMMIALANSDGSFTCTLFMPHTSSSPYNFQNLRRRSDVDQFFQKEFPGFLKLVPDASEQFFSHPTGKMITVKAPCWHYKGEALLLGDAAHAIVPFFGQGMNCGFEDVTEFQNLMDTENDWETLFKKVFAVRKTNTDAIADMAVENLTEMSDKTADEKFLYQKKIEKHLQEKFPKEYISRYSMVSFSQIPYRLAYEAGVEQAKILSALTDKYYPSENIDDDYAHAMIKNLLGPLMQKIDNFKERIL